MMQTPALPDRPFRRKTAILGAIAAAVLAAGTSAARQADLHALFEDRCQRCHGHSGEFAQSTLQLDAGGDVTGSRGQPLGQFLRRHGGGLGEAEIDGMLALFARQIASGALFRNRCRICHDRAYDLARLKLILRDGTLFGRYTGREIGPFLTGHGRLTADEARRMTEALAAILQGRR